MDYTPHTEEDVATMLGTLGLEHVSDLYRPIPEALQLKTLDLPAGMTELEATQLVDSIASKTARSAPDISFLGAGAYDHFAPSVVDAMISRGEFFTAYTPYQPEVSQGTLRVIFEFQTMMCELTGMEVANASMYDGSSALAEGRDDGGQDPVCRSCDPAEKPPSVLSPGCGNLHNGHRSGDRHRALD